MKVSSILLIILSLIIVTEARIINIPAEFDYIQEGIDNSSEGDTVLVASGTYYEQLVLSGKSITLASTFLISKNLD